MVRNYQRRRGSRVYKNYTVSTVDKAVDDVRKGRKTLRKASEAYNIPLATLSRKTRNLQFLCAGGQKRLSDDCEKMIVSALGILAKWKIPLTAFETRLLVKNYLDALPLAADIFFENMPGRDWLRGFMRRHNLTKRKADKISSSRGRLSDETLNLYFDELEKELQGIPDSNIFNYDETNLTDDPSSKVVIVHRGLSRVERIVEHSKSSTSVMFCGSADGNYLPPMIVYKCESESVYSTWIGVDGPDNAEYASTKSGWFNKRTFSQWFFNVFLPVASKLSGPTVLIGDNLGSHFSHDVIEATIRHDIRFITMPPSSTHMCQPLDVAVFRTLKLNWRKILDDYRKTSRRTGVIRKAHIPQLLSRLCSKLSPGHLKNGFRACGIYPIDRREVLKRLRGGDIYKTDKDDLNLTVFNESVMAMLQENCGQGADDNKVRRGRKITYGKRIVTLNRNKTDAEWLKKNCWTCEEEDGDRDDGDRWLGCDTCEKWYHLQCSDFEYDDDDYYKIDLKSVKFRCKNH